MFYDFTANDMTFYEFTANSITFLHSFRVWALINKRLHQESATTALWRRG